MPGFLLELFAGLARVRTSVMAGHTSDGGDGFPLVILVEGKIFFVDLAGHLVHMTGDILFRLGIAGEIQPVRSTVGRRRMAKTAFHSKGILPFIHHFLQLLVRDVLFQDLEIVFRWFGIVLGTEGGYAGYDEAKQ